MAWRVDSIRPGIVFHTLIDSVAFLWAVFKIEDLKAIMEYSLIEHGLTPGFGILLVATLLLTIATLGAFARLHRTAQAASLSRSVKSRV